MDILQTIRDGYRTYRNDIVQLRRRTASELYGLGGEVSIPFYELLVIEAEHARSTGALTRSEALLRRAALVADHLDHDRHDARGRLADWYRSRPAFEPSALESIDETSVLASAHLTCALMRYAPSIDYTAYEPMPELLFFLVSGRLRSTARSLSDAVAPLVESLFAEANRALAEHAPSDPNFIGVTGSSIAEISLRAILDTPREQLCPPVYASSCLFVLDVAALAPVSLPTLVDLALRNGKHDT